VAALLCDPTKVAQGTSATKISGGRAACFQLGSGNLVGQSEIKKSIRTYPSQIDPKKFGVTGTDGGGAGTERREKAKTPEIAGIFRKGLPTL